MLIFAELLLLLFVKTEWAEHIGEECKRGYYKKNWSQSKKRAFTKSCTKLADELSKKEIEKDFNQVTIFCIFVLNNLQMMIKLGSNY